jgi:hypothetical protein
MSGRISAIVLTLLWLHSSIVFGQAHFKRFTETVTNNGAYVLGWGLKDDPAGSVDSKTEIVADGPEKIDIESIGVDVETYERIEDYLVDTATGKIVATIPDFTYYAGSEGRENHFGLEVGWSPDNRGGIAIYQARYTTDKVAWINPTEHKTSNVWPQIEKAVRRVAVRKEGKEAADYEISVSNPVFVRSQRVVMDAVVGALSSKKPDAPSYSFEILFDVKGNLDAPQLELASAKSVSDESGRDIGDNEIEAQLNKAYHKLATALPPRDREGLKQEQLKWLATREHITAAQKDEKEFIQLRLTRRRVAELETRARYR